MKAFALALLLAVSPVAARAAGNLDAAENHMDRALEEVLSALEFVLRAIPQYEMPEVMPNGDIIIRRVPPEEPPPSAPESPPENPSKEAPDKDGVRT